MSEVRVKGLADLNRFLQQLPVKVEQNILRSALRAGANVVAGAAKDAVPEDTGLLKAGIKVSTRSRRGKVTASVKATGKHAYIAPWIEYGTAAHRIVAKGKGMYFGGKFVQSVDHPGTPPRPFMRPALHTKAQEAVVAAAQHMKRRLATKHGLDTSDVEIEAE